MWDVELLLIELGEIDDDLREEVWWGEAKDLGLFFGLFFIVFCCCCKGVIVEKAVTVPIEHSPPLK